MRQAILFLALIHWSLQALTVDAVPFLKFQTPNSILQNPPDRFTWVGKRIRLSTCSDIKWTKDGTHLLSLSLVQASLTIYQFENHNLKTEAIYDLRTLFNMRDPEKIALSPQEDTLAICSSDNVYLMPFENKKMKPSLLMRFEKRNCKLVHAINYSQNGHYLCYGTFDEAHPIRLYKKTNLKFTLIQTLENPFKHLKVKGLVFSQNDQFVVIAYSPNIIRTESALNYILVSYPFNSQIGKIHFDPISIVHGIGCIEEIALSNDSRLICGTDQDQDKILGFDFDPLTGKIGDPRVLLENPQSQLSFPHGISFSPDNKILSVSNYGDDTINFYQLNNCP